MCHDARPRSRSKEEVEKLVVKEFLQTAGFKCREISDSTEGQGSRQYPGPDVIADILLEGGTWRKVGIEVAGYWGDADATGGSLAMRTDSEHMALMAEVKTQVEAQAQAHPQLSEFRPVFSYDRANLPSGGTRAAVAGEIVRLLLAQHCGDLPKSLRRHDGAFQDYPLVEQHFTKIEIPAPAGSWNDPGLWPYDNAGWVSLVQKVVTTEIEDKTRKLPKYLREGLDERWLLVAATGPVAAGLAGPLRRCEADLLSPEILSLAAGSGFDRVFFWERTDTWVVCLFSRCESSPNG